MPIASIDVDLTPLAKADVDRYIEQYSGVWVAEPTRFSQMSAIVEQLGLLRGGGLARTPMPRSRFYSVGSVRIAEIPIEGTLTKCGSCLTGAGSMIEQRRAVRAAARDDKIGAIILRIDSPGGQLAGLAELVAEIKAAAARKPVTAFIEDCCCAGAYWAASQCTRVVANRPAAVVGSIGDFMGLYDRSEQFERRGVKSVVLRSSPLKGAGFPGEAITDEQKAVWQELVDHTGHEFSAAIQAGRKLSDSQVAAVAIGRVWPAAETIKLGLVDAVETFDEALRSLASQVRSKQTQSKTHGVASAIARQSTLLPAAKAASTSKGETMSSDTTPLDPIAEFDGRVRAKTAAGMSRREAIKTVTRADRGLHARYLSATNPNTKAAVKLDLIAAGDEAAAAAQPGAEAVAAFNELVALKVQTGMSRTRAAVIVAKSNPNLHKQFLIATNPRNRSGAAECADALHR